MKLLLALIIPPLLIGGSVLIGLGLIWVAIHCPTKILFGLFIAIIWFAMAIAVYRDLTRK